MKLRHEASIEFECLKYSDLCTWIGTRFHLRLNGPITYWKNLASAENKLILTGIDEKSVNNAIRKSTNEDTMEITMILGGSYE